VNSALTRFSAKLRAEDKTQLAAGLLRSGLLFKLILSMAMSAFCFIFSDFLATYILNRPEMGFLVKLASSLVLFQAIFTTLNSAFIGLDKTEGSALLMSAQSVAKTTISPILVVFGFSIVGALTGQIASYMIACITGGLVFSKYYKELGKPSKSGFSGNLKAMLDYGFPLYLSALLTLVLSNYQTIILAFFASNAEIGNFNIARSLSSLITVIIFPLAILFPAFSKINPNSHDLKKIFQLAVKYTALLVVPAAVIIATLSKEIVQTLYGYDYNLAPSFLSLYILTFLYTGAGSIVLIHLFNGIGQTKVVFKYNLINLLIFLPLAPMLTMFYGVPGLIIAFLVANLLSLAYGLAVANRNIDVNPDLKTSLRIYSASFLSAIPVLVFLHVLPLNNAWMLIIGGSIFLLAYLTFTPITGAISHDDIQNLNSIITKIRILRAFLKPLLAYEAKLLSIRSNSSGACSG